VRRSFKRIFAFAFFLLSFCVAFCCVFSPAAFLSDSFDAVLFDAVLFDHTIPYESSTKHALTQSPAAHQNQNHTKNNHNSWLPVPEFAVSALLGEGAAVVLEGQRVLPARAQAAGFEFKYPELSAALRQVLGK
jgi:hypothetical protein